MFNFKKLRKNVKAISPVISVLLMIAVAVVASLVAYAWVMGYMNFQTNKTGNAIQIQSISIDGSVYVQNTGSGTVSFQDTCLFIDGKAYVTNATAVTTLEEGTTLALKISGTTPFTAGTHIYTVKATCREGTFSEVTKNFPL